MADNIMDKIEDMDAGEKILWVTKEVDNAMKANSVERSQMQNDFHIYSGLYNKQWSADSLAQLDQDKRSVVTFNWVQHIVDIVLGHMIKNPYMVKFDPVLDEVDGVDGVSKDEIRKKRNILDSVYEYDYERGNYEYEEMDAIQNAIIHTGVIELFKDYRNDDLGNIGIRSINPLYVIKDPYWSSNDERDCRWIAKFSWQTAQDIKDNYDAKSEEIQNAIDDISSHGTNYDAGVSEDLNKLADRRPEYFDVQGDRYKVIELVYTKRIKRRRYYDKVMKDFVYPEDEMQEVRMRLEDRTFLPSPEEITIVKLITVCPALSNNLILAEGDHPIQIGRLPYFFISAKNLHGERQGIVAKLADAQMVLNKREAMYTDWQLRASNGTLLVEEDAFVNDEDYAEFAKNVNKPGVVARVSSGTIASQKIKYLDRGAPPQDFVQSVDRAIRFMESASNLASALQARSEGANESGILFDMKIDTALIPYTSLEKQIERYKNAMGECYFYLFKDVYRDAPRIFQNNKGELIALNQYVNDGRIINNVADIKRHNVLVSLSKTGMARRKQMMATYMNLSRSMQNPALRSYYELLMTEYTDLPGADTNQIREYAYKFLDLQMAQMDVQIMQLKQQLQPQQPNPMAMLQGAGGTQEEQTSMTRDASVLPGMGNLPMNIAGGENIGNNRAAPSDMR